MKRIASIDAMRGFAMVLVITQHAFHLATVDLAQSSVGTLIYAVTRMASVAFMVVSGAMIGFFQSKASDQGKLVRRYLKRAIVVALSGHLLIPLVRYFYYQADPGGRFLHNLAADYPITDTIAVCLAIGVIIITRMSSRKRGMLAIALLVVTPAIQLLWSVEGKLAIIIKEALFGAPFVETPIAVPWPLVPWLGVFLIGSIGGAAIGQIWKKPESVERKSRDFLKVSLLLFACGMALSVAYKLLRVHAGDLFSTEFFHVIYPTRSTLLLPVYLGILLAVLALILRIVRAGSGSLLPVWVLTVFGRTSLFTYITQFIYVHTLPAIAGYKGNLTLTGYIILLLLSLPASWITSYGYGRISGKIKGGDRAQYLNARL